MPWNHPNKQANQKQKIQTTVAIAINLPFCFWISKNKNLPAEGRKFLDVV